MNTNNDRYQTCSIEFLNWMCEQIKISENNDSLNIIGSKNSEYTRDFLIWSILDQEDFSYLKRDLSYFLIKVGIFSDLDLEILFESLKNSYVSLFDFSVINGKNILYDILLEREYELSDPLSLESEDMFISRIISYEDENYLLGNQHFFSEELLDIYFDVLNDYFDESNIDTFKGIDSKLLKSITIDFYRIYLMSKSILDEKNRQQRVDGSFYELFTQVFSEEDLDIFEVFLNEISELSDRQINRQDAIYHFHLIYGEGLNPLGKNFSSPDLNFKEIYKNMALDGQFHDRNELFNSIWTLKTFFESSEDERFKKNLKELEEILSNFFYYLQKLKSSVKGYFNDENLRIYMEDCCQYALNFLYDFENFIDYAQYESLTLRNDGGIYIKNLRELVNLLDLKVKKDLKYPSLKSYPLLEIFMNFAITKDILFKDNNNLEISNESYRYLESDPGSKLGIWLNTLTKDEFYLMFMSKTKLQKHKSMLVRYLRAIKQEEKTLPIIDDGLLEVLFRLGILSTESKKIKFTEFGLRLYNYFDRIRPRNSVIWLKK